MKILIISPTEKGIGGIAQHVGGLSNFLKSKNHEVEVMSSENTFTIPIKGLKNPSFVISSFLKSKFKKGYDIIHAHNIPSALAMKNFDGKKILTLHGVYSQQIEKLHGETASKLTSNFEKNALEWADAITVVSKEAYNYYNNLGFKVHLIPNAFDYNKIPKGKKRIYQHQIIFVGRLSIEKGVDLLVEAFNKINKNFHLIIIGDGPEKKNLQKKCSNDNVHFLGYLPHKETLEYLKGSDILVQPSRKEGISTTILEAMSCKIPIIATKVGGNVELIVNEKTGLLIDSENPKQIVSSITRLMNDKELCNQITQQAFEKYLENYEWKKVGNQYLELYKSLIS